MKDIRIFIASSRELLQERNELAFLVIAHEDEFARRGLRVRLAKWEYVDPMMTADRTEDRYLNEMYNCDAAFILFKNVAGKYTQEEFEKALVKEQEGAARLKIHQVLFHSQCTPGSDAAKLKQTLPTGGYSIWSDMAELKKMFLSLVDRVAENPNLVDFPPDKTRTVSAFIAADEELAADRNAFADAVLNLNDILVRRHVRIRLRFYEPLRHRDILELSEMALVLYHTTSNAFGIEQMQDAYARTMHDENPRRLYVFFRNEDESHLDKSFLEFRESFEKCLGHFFCRFENVDTLKLNFLLSVENLLDETEPFVILDGTKVKADELVFGEITQLPMVANNVGFNELIVRRDLADDEFKSQQAVCRENPNDDIAFAKLFSLSKQKNKLDSEVEREISRFFNLAKRMATISAKEANETIQKARSLLDQGEFDEAVRLLDDAASEIDKILHDIAEIDDLMGEKLKSLEAWIEVELFHADAVLAHTREAFPLRFAKAEGIFMALLDRSEEVLSRNGPRLLAEILCHFSALYASADDYRSSIPLLEKALKLYRQTRSFEFADSQENIATALNNLGIYYESQSCWNEVERVYGEALEIWRRLAAANPEKFNEDVARTLNNLGIFYSRQNQFDKAERVIVEALEIRRHLAMVNPTKFDASVATSLGSLGLLYGELNRFEDAEHAITESLKIQRRLAGDNPARPDIDLALALRSLGIVYSDQNRLDDAERMYEESLSILSCLAAENPARFETLLASSYHMLGNLHNKQSRLDDARRMYEESLTTYRRLATDNPERFDESVATLLNDIGNNCRAQNRFEDAEHAFVESLKIRRRLATGNPTRFDEDMATSLNNLGILYDGRNRWEEAERVYGESLEIWRRLAVINPAKFDKEVAGTLNNLGILYARQDRFEEAERVYAEALETYRRLVTSSFDKFEEYVVKTLVNIAPLLEKQNRLADATHAYAEALRVYQRLTTRLQAKYEVDMAIAADSLGRLCRFQNCFKEAEHAYDTSLAIWRRLASRTPLKFEGAVAIVLDCLGDLYGDMCRLDDAERVYLESLKIWRRLAVCNHTKYDENLARELHSLGSIYNKQNRFDEAEHMYTETLEIYRHLVAGHPEQYDPYMAKILKDLAQLYSGQHCMREAKFYYGEAAKFYGRCEKRTSGDVYLQELVLTRLLSIFGTARNLNRVRLGLTICLIAVLGAIICFMIR